MLSTTCSFCDVFHPALVCLLDIVAWLFFHPIRDGQYYSLCSYHIHPIMPILCEWSFMYIKCGPSAKWKCEASCSKSINIFKIVTANHQAKCRALSTHIISFSLQFKNFEDGCFCLLLVIFIIHEYALNIKIHKRKYNENWAAFFQNSQSYCSGSITLNYLVWNVPCA